MAILTKYISFYNINEENELMVNALSGAIDIIDSETKSIIHKFSEQDNIKALNAREKNIYDSLKKRGYIFEDRNHEL
ncbi:TPA: radical SAM protein, partial [Enterococcus faecium]|nr:radical SAM protein [Enterococcus faecium]